MEQNSPIFFANRQGRTLVCVRRAECHPTSTIASDAPQSAENASDVHRLAAASRLGDGVSRLINCSKAERGIKVLRPSFLATSLFAAIKFSIVLTETESSDAASRLLTKSRSFIFLRSFSESVPSTGDLVGIRAQRKADQADSASLNGARFVRRWEPICDSTLRVGAIPNHRGEIWLARDLHG